MTVFAMVDDKYVPLYRVMWVSAVPHFCGHAECQHEGDYEVALEHGESVWAKRQERDDVLAALEAWHRGVDRDELEDDDEEEDDAQF